MSNWQSKLQAGDEVTWNDPDEGIASRTDIIRDIKHIPEAKCASIIWSDGSNTDVFYSELS